MKGKTTTGFKYEISDEAKKDWATLDAICDAESSDPVKQAMGARNLAKALLRDQVDDLIEHIRKKNNGNAPIDLVFAELKEILESGDDETKNS